MIEVFCMQRVGLSGIYESYIADETNRDTQEANEIYEKIMHITKGIFSADLQNETLDLINLYASNVEKRSFKDGFRYAIQLWKECEKE